MSFLRCMSLCLVYLLLAGRLAALELQDNDRIVIMGNGFAEGMYRHGWLEAALQAAHPEKQLRVRNMGWSGDTPALQPRELNFGSMPEHLARQQAGVIIASWGMNESFAGDDGLAGFEAALQDWVSDMQEARFNGERAPRLVLLSPIAHENLGPPLPDGSVHNTALAQYTEVMRTVSIAKGIDFVDLYSPSLAYYRSGAQRPLTRNGIHPTEYGYWFLTQQIVRQLGIAQVDAPSADPTAVAALRRMIWDKNWHFFLFWRPVNMEYIRGRRREPFGVENFPREFEQLDDMVRARDEAIWDRARSVQGAVWNWQPGRREMWEQLPSYEASSGEVRK